MRSRTLQFLHCLAVWACANLPSQASGGEARSTCAAVVSANTSAQAGWQAEVDAPITDDFILVPNPRECDPSKLHRVVFTAPRIIP